MLVTAFRKFGMIRVEWPGKDQAASQPKGYVYIIFESEKQVMYKMLENYLNVACTVHFSELLQHFITNNCT
jgi:hypothetical protein